MTIKERLLNVFNSSRIEKERKVIEEMEKYLSIEKFYLEDLLNRNIEMNEMIRSLSDKEKTKTGQWRNNSNYGWIKEY